MNAANFPTFNWMRGVAADRRITIVHRFILVRLLLYRGKDGRCDPGYDTLAAELGVHRATVFRAVDVGIRRGWIAARAAHGGRALHNFVLTFPLNEPSQPCDGLEASGA